MNEQVKEALLQLAEMCARAGYREIDPMWPIKAGTAVVALDDIYAEIMRQGVPESDLAARFDAAAIAAGR